MLQVMCSFSPSVTIAEHLPEQKQKRPRGYTVAFLNCCVNVLKNRKLHVSQQI